MVGSTRNWWVGPTFIVVVSDNTYLENDLSRLTRHDQNKIRQILRGKFDYYNELSLKGKKKFFKRLISFTWISISDA